MTATWKGVMEINPVQDNWMETEIAPQLIINTEGNYNAVTAAIGNNMGVVWNSWQTTWQGIVVRDDGMPPPPPQPVPPAQRQLDPWQDDMDDGTGNDGASKVVCSAMNEDYGFGSYRNAVWIQYSKLKYSNSPEYEIGYHKIALPLLAMRHKHWFGRKIYKLMKYAARHRTADLRAEMQNKKRDTIGKALRFVLEPTCFIVGKIEIMRNR